VGEGPGRINASLVRSVVRAVARRLRGEVQDAAGRGVVVARDARHGSASFADAAVDVLSAHGLDVHLFDEPVPTPLAAFAVRELGAAAGIVVTASHNPPADNGLKVIWEDGAQVSPPVEAGILAEMATGGEPPGSDRGHVHHLGGSTGSHPTVEAYVRFARSLVPGAPVVSLRVAHTPLHGVGGDLLERVLAAVGHRDVHAVASQRLPDPDFPTVTYPNPEEAGALDALLGVCAEVGAEVGLATDPDADRLAVCLRSPAGWRTLTGDEVGALLLHHLLGLTRAIDKRLVATTVVSSRLPAKMCLDAGVRFHVTPTGFKWLCRPGIEHPDHHQVLLYEEALGYAVGHGVRDKDGITAAVVVLDLLAALRSDGRTADDLLDHLALRHGAHVSQNGSLRLDEATADGGGATERERLVLSPPTLLAGTRVSVVDHPVEGVVRMLLEDDTRILVRPSGTEPKLKYYCEAIEPVAGLDGVAAAREAARSRLRSVVDSLTPLLTER
jgi:phosphomannomutase